MQITVNVTQKHIDKGSRRNSGDCPITRAMLDAGFTMALTGTVTVGGVWTDGVTYFSNTPAEVLAFINAYDLVFPVAPFSFALEMEPKFRTDGTAMVLNHLFRVKVTNIVMKGQYT